MRQDVWQDTVVAIRKGGNELVVGHLDPSKYASQTFSTDPNQVPLSVHCAACQVDMLQSRWRLEWHTLRICIVFLALFCLLAVWDLTSHTSHISTMSSHNCKNTSSLAAGGGHRQPHMGQLLYVCLQGEPHPRMFPAIFIFSFTWPAQATPTPLET